MQLSALFFLPLLQVALAAPFSDFQIPLLRARDGYRANTTSISFTFQDTNTNASAECTVTFRNGGVNDAAFPSKRYRACGNDTSFGFKFAGYEGIHNFQLDLLRRFRDPSVGDPPQDIVTLFGSTNVTQGSDYVCHTSYRGGQNCRTSPGTVMNVPITGAVAKK